MYLYSYNLTTVLQVPCIYELPGEVTSTYNTVVQFSEYADYFLEFHAWHHKERFIQSFPTWVFMQIILFFYAIVINYSHVQKWTW